MFMYLAKKYLHSTINWFIYNIPSFNTFLFIIKFWMKDQPAQSKIVVLIFWNWVVVSNTCLRLTINTESNA